MRWKALVLSVSLAWAGAVGSVATEEQYVTRRTVGKEVPTFNKDVAPIVFKNCAGCHRPGEIAPMSLLTYEDARPWAKAIRDEVSDRNMPPWHADAPRGTFHNERYLTDAERQTLVAWANGGAPRGDASDLPAAPVFVDGWAVGKPDVIFEMPEEYRLPADGTIAYEYFYMPTNFTEPRWVTGIEIRPGNREVVHHALLYHRTKAEDAPVSKVLLRNPAHSKAPESATGTRPPRDDIRQQLPALNLIATYAPGTNPQVAPAGTAFRFDPGAC
jgi:hypothetical protein